MELYFCLPNTSSWRGAVQADGLYIYLNLNNFILQFSLLTMHVLYRNTEKLYFLIF